MMLDKEKEIKNIIASYEMEGLKFTDLEIKRLYECNSVEDCERMIQELVRLFKKEDVN